MDRTEFESVPFAYAAEADELSWEDERGRSPSAPRGRPGPQRGRPTSPRGPSAQQRGKPSPQRGRPPAPRGRPAPPRPGPRPPPRPVPPFGTRLPFGGLAIPTFGAAAPCVCPAHGTEFVRWVQASLNQVEGAALPIDGVMGAATRAALRRFQSSKGLPVDGIAGPEVEQALRDARRGDAPSGGDTAGSAGGDTAPPESAEVFEFETLQFESPAGRPTLRQGSRGTAVVDLQRRLASAGFSPGAADGIFGSQTAAAVRSFQRARGLGADGIVGPLTWGALLGTAPGWPSGPSAPTGPSTPSTPGAGTASGVWVLPPSVRAAGDAQTVRYDNPPAWAGVPGNCTGTFTDGAATLKAYLQANFAGISGIYGYDCRANSATPSETSVHGTGRALDIMIPMVGGRANSAVGDPIANWLVTNASALGVQYVIWNRVRWSGSRTPRVAPYTGPSPHTDHVHMELNHDGANRRTAWFRDHEVADEAVDEFADASEFEFEDGLGAAPAGAHLNCGPASGSAVPDPGTCVPGIGDASCTQGVWYRPKRGDSLWTVARRTIRNSGQTRVRVLDYARQISRHRHNAQYLARSGSGLATRQFLNLWGGPDGRTPVGPGGGYGMMFLPPFGPGQERATCPRP